MWGKLQKERIMLKLAIIGALGYAGYRYLEKNGGLPDRQAIDRFTASLKEKAGVKQSPTRTQA